MSTCPYANKNPCDHTDQSCPFIRNVSTSVVNCALWYLLEKIKKYEKSYSEESRQLISMFKDKYVKKWNIFKNSRARGRATGKAFEDFILGLLVKYGKIDRDSLKTNRWVPVINGVKYPVDIVYMEKDSIKAVVEIKLGVDIQQAMAFAGLLGLSNYRFALVMFYEPREDVGELLSYIQSKYADKFRYFSIIKEPEKAKDELVRFIKSN